jgi:hypothetical protein
MKGMPMKPDWQKSSYCSEGASCVHVATGAETIHLTESSDPTGAILSAAPTAFGALLAVLKGTWTRTASEATGPGPWIEVAFGESVTGDAGDDGDDPVYLRETSDPATVVTTNRRRWDAFVLGVRAGEFDHFVAGHENPHA